MSYTVSMDASGTVTCVLADNGQTVVPLDDPAFQASAAAAAAKFTPEQQLLIQAKQAIAGGTWSNLTPAQKDALLMYLIRRL